VCDRRQHHPGLLSSSWRESRRRSRV